MGAKNRDRPSWVRVSGIGFEFAAAVAGFTVAGWWIDRHYESSPIGVLIGVVLGLIGGMYNLIRKSLQASSEAESERRSGSPKGPRA